MGVRRLFSRVGQKFPGGGRGGQKLTFCQKTTTKKILVYSKILKTYSPLWTPMSLIDLFKCRLLSQGDIAVALKWATLAASGSLVFAVQLGVQTLPTLLSGKSSAIMILTVKPRGSNSHFAGRKLFQNNLHFFTFKQNLGPQILSMDFEWPKKL